VPAFTTYTARDLRVVAAILDVLTKARATNQRMGIPTTPDEFTAQFPTGHIAVVHWTEGIQSSSARVQRALEKGTRHRAAYHLSMTEEPNLDEVTVLQDPQPVQRGHAPIGDIVQLHGAPQGREEFQKMVRAIVGKPTPGQRDA
jgi:hypothetical protein